MHESLAWIRTRLDQGEDPEAWEDPELVRHALALQAEAPAFFDEVEKRVRSALSGRSATAWLSRLTRKKKAAEAEAAAKKKAAEIAAAKKRHSEAGVPSFELGDDAEVGAELYRRIEQEHEGPVVAGFGGGRSKQIWAWDKGPGLYEALTEEQLRCRVYAWSGALIGEDARPLLVNEGRCRGIVTAAHAFAAQQHGYEAEFFSDPPAGVTFADAFVTIQNAALVAVDLAPEHRQRWALPFKYDPHARCERWLGFLNEVLEDELAVLALQEFVGACLLGMAGGAGVALVLLGRGANGKSTVLKVIRHLFGDDAISVPPQHWSDDPKTIPFAHARINIVEELPSADVMATADFKAIVDGAYITRRPLYQAPISFVARPGNLFAANELPYAPDPTDGFWRKWMILQFHRQWDTDGSKPHLPRADATLRARLMEELPGIATWGIVGASRFLAQHRRLTTVDHSTEAVAGWRHESDRVAQWIEERCLRSRAPLTPAKTLYANYRSWCAENGYSPYNVTRWGTAVVRLGVEKRRNNGMKYALDVADTMRLL